MRPDYANALSNRGNTLHELKRFEEAVASYDRALVLRPDYVEALNNRGNALKALTRSEEALASYDRALALRPDSTDALNNRGNILNELKRFEEALASYDRVLTLRPTMPRCSTTAAAPCMGYNGSRRRWRATPAPSKCGRIMPMCITMRRCAGYSLATLIAAGKNTNGDGKLGN